jgi:hypothetical protein
MEPKNVTGTAVDGKPYFDAAAQLNVCNCTFRAEDN